MRRRFPIIVFLAAVLAAGFWFLRQQEPADVASVHVESPRVAGTATPMPEKDAQPAPSSEPAEQSADLRHGRTSSETSRTTASPGSLRMPASLSQESLARLRAMEADLNKADAAFRDYKTLQAMEGRDPDWSPMIEGHFATHLQANGQGYDGLEVSAAHCSRTVCSLSAVVKPGVPPTASSADWQSLMFKAYGDAWFQENFVDARLTMGGDANGTMYVAFFERK